MTAKTTVTINLQDCGLTAVDGKVVFTPPFPIVDSTTGGLILDLTKTVDVVAGVASVDLLPSDAAGINPSGWAYRVQVESASTQQIGGTPLPVAVSFQFQAVVSASAGPVALSSILVQTAPPGTTAITTGGITQAAADARYATTATVATKVGKGELTLNARDYGAVGNGTTDDTTALQAWLDACKAGNRRGFLPAGHYIISSTITFTQTVGWQLGGESTGPSASGAATSIRWVGAAGGTMLLVQGCREGILNNILLDGDNVAGIGLDYDAVRGGNVGSNNVMERMFVFRCTNRAVRIGHSAFQVDGTAWRDCGFFQGGPAGRTLTDVAATAGSTTITSATANFVAGDVGRTVEGSPFRFGLGATIASVTNATTAVLTVASTSTGTNIVTRLGIVGGIGVSIEDANAVEHVFDGCSFTTLRIGITAVEVGTGGQFLLNDCRFGGNDFDIKPYAARAAAYVNCTSEMSGIFLYGGGNSASGVAFSLIGCSINGVTNPRGYGIQWGFASPLTFIGLSAQNLNNPNGLAIPFKILSQQKNARANLIGCAFPDGSPWANVGDEYGAEVYVVGSSFAAASTAGVPNAGDGPLPLGTQAVPKFTLATVAAGAPTARGAGMVWVKIASGTALAAGPNLFFLLSDSATGLCAVDVPFMPRLGGADAVLLGITGQDNNAAVANSVAINVRCSAAFTLTSDLVFAARFVAQPATY